MEIPVKFQCNQCGNRFIESVDEAALKAGAAVTHKCPACDSTNVEMRVRR